MLLSCADQSFSQQLQPPKSSKKRAVWVPSPPSVPFPHERESPRSALQTYLRENLFLKALIVFAIMGAISATEKEKKKTQIKTNKKNPRALKQQSQTRRAESNSKLQPWQNRHVCSPIIGYHIFTSQIKESPLCFLHCKNTVLWLNSPFFLTQGAALQFHCSKQLDRHRRTAGGVRQGFCLTSTIRTAWYSQHWAGKWIWCFPILFLVQEVWTDFITLSLWRGERPPTSTLLHSLDFSYSRSSRFVRL